MKQSLAAVIFGWSAFFIGSPLFADTTTTQPVQTTKTDRLNFAPGGTIRLDNSFGSLSVEGWDEAEVEITVVKSMGYNAGPSQKAEQRMDELKVLTDHRSETELIISTTRPARPSRFRHPLGTGREAVAEYRIRVPRNSRLVISHARGYVSVTGVTGDIEATNSRGDIVLLLPDLTAYTINARTKVGLVTSDVAGAVHNKHLLGETFTRGDATLSRRLSLKMGFGGITIKELRRDAVAPVATGIR